MIGGPAPRRVPAARVVAAPAPRVVTRGVTGLVTWLVTALLATALAGAPARAALPSDAPQPIDVVREHVGAAIAILKDPAYAERAVEQRDRLCAIAHQLFDIETFSRLVLMGSWQDLDAAAQREFVAVFGDFLCRYYLSRLQIYYDNELVTFSEQEFKSDTRATVAARVEWRGLEIPVEVRMGYRDGHWRAFDVVVSGISAVLVYRAQIQPRLLEITPRELIEELRQRIAEQG
ncbi:MAG: ABC transporter substrate-binding protein [Gammaproteobacteria bacterium]